MQFLYWLEGLRTPFGNTVMSLLTEFGAEAAFLLVALSVFWCFDKKKGYYILSVGFFGTILNQFLKLVCQIPRPWVRDPNFTIVESARAGATGYSFPSGHTQNAVGTYGAIAVTTKKKWVRVLSIALCVLVPFSRMYLGVHTPQDVLTAAGTAILLLFLLYFGVYTEKKAVFPVLLGVMLVLSAGFVAFVEVYPFGKDIDAANLAEGVKNAYTLLGALLGMLLVYWADNSKFHFPIHAVWWAQIIKLIAGFALVMAVRIALKAPLAALCGGHSIASGIRYFLVVLTAGIVWPLTFPWFSRLGQKKES